MGGRYMDLSMRVSALEDKLDKLEIFVKNSTNDNDRRLDRIEEWRSANNDNNKRLDIIEQWRLANIEEKLANIERILSATNRTDYPL